MPEILNDMRDMSEYLVYLLEQERHEEAQDVARYIKRTSKLLSVVRLMDQVDAELDRTAERG